MSLGALLSTDAPLFPRHPPRFVLPPATDSCSLTEGRPTMYQDVLHASSPALHRYLLPSGTGKVLIYSENDFHDTDMGVVLEGTGNRTWIE